VHAHIHYHYHVRVLGSLTELDIESLEHSSVGTIPQGLPDTPLMQKKKFFSRLFLEPVQK